MEVRDQRRIGDRREVDQNSGEGRRIRQGRRTWDRRYDSRAGWTDGSKFDRRGAHPSLFAVLGFPVSRGVRRRGPPRRGGEVRRSSIRRYVDRRAP